MLRQAPTTRTAGLLVLVALGVVGIYFAARAGGSAAGAFAVVTLVCGVALALRAARSAEPGQLDWVFDQVLIAVPGALIIYLSFESGGYFPQGPAVAAIFLIVVLVLRITLVDEPLT